MKFLTEANVKQTLTMDEVIEAVMMAYRSFSDKLIDVPSRITMQIRGESNSVIFLIANYHSIPYYGIKQASSFPTNTDKGKPTVYADIHLYSADTGEPLAIVSANHLTAMKTGAASAVATKLLARQNASTLAIIGTGVQARAQLAGIERVRSLHEVRLYDRNRVKAEEFLRRMNNRAYSVTITETPNECIQSADIVVTATTSNTPVFSGDHLREGAHINAVGSFTPLMQEIDAKTVLKASKIVTDNEKETMMVAGDLLMPMNQGQVGSSVIYAELGDILTGKTPARENEEEITIYESVGFAALDIAVAVAAYEKSLGLGIGTPVTWEA